MYTIGEFSKITQITVKALRYYDEQGLLKPSHRAQNAYRYYSEADFERAELIRFLRGLNFGIAEIKEVLALCNGKEDLSYILAEKRDQIAQQITQQKALMEQLDLYLHPANKEVPRMPYHIQQKSYPALPVLSVRFTGNHQQINQHISALYKEVKGQSAGAPFMLYHQAEYNEQSDCELCIPVKLSAKGRQAASTQLPAIQAIVTQHTGPYQHLNLAYKALLDYARQNHLTCLLPSREIYLKGPGMLFKGNPHKYVTEIAIPVEKEA